MGLKTIEPLMNRHPNADIYVLGSGASLGFIKPNFFESKIVVCVNYTIDYPSSNSTLYLVAKEPTTIMQKIAHDKGAKIIMCEHHSGVSTNPKNIICYPDETYIFNPLTNVIKHPLPRKALERSSSTIVSGMHMAAFLGAKNIILVGHDCGTLDGKVHVTNYNKIGSVRSENSYKGWMSTLNVESKSVKAKKQIEAVYKANIYSLNPFINFGLEGHVYKRFKSKSSF